MRIEQEVQADRSQAASSSSANGSYQLLLIATHAGAQLMVIPVNSEDPGRHMSAATPGFPLARE